MVYGGGVRAPQRVILINAVLCRREMIDELEELIPPVFGNIFLKSEVFPFDHTDYYEKEMGTDLWKYFVAHSRKILPDEIIDYKLAAVDFEDKLLDSGKRCVNIDPGYVALEKVVAASTKNFTHRIYLGKSIYGDLQLYRKDGRYNPLPWTFFDYSLPKVLKFFDEVRTHLFEENI